MPALLSRSLPPLLVALAVCAGVSSWLLAADGNNPAASVSNEEVARLIEQLGSPQFATREKAQAKLEMLGVAVFDELLDAQEHSDIEVARRARYLLRGVPIAWTVDTDPAEVRSVMRDYGEQGRIERQSRIAHLASMAESMGAGPLCRIVCFESDVILSKQAALKLMWHEVAETESTRKQLARTIRQSVANSRRPAVRWALAYADSLETPNETLDTWQQITRDEMETFVKDPEQTQRTVVRDLLRWHIDLLRRLEQRDDVRANIIRVVELVEPERKELFDVVDWALEREEWFVPELLSQRFPAEYWQDEMLVYRLAEAKRRQGDEAAAAGYAKQALEMSPKQWNVHFDVARNLRFERYMFDWSEAEFRLIIATASELVRVELLARGFLAEMLADLQREKDAADIMEAWFEIGEKDPAALASASEALYHKAYSTADVRAKIDHLLGVHYGRVGEIEKQKMHLKAALNTDADNIDIVIALHHVADSSEAWKQESKTRLASHVQRIESRMNELEQAVASNEERDMRDLIVEEFAQKNNEFAWLVSNTVGDYQKAVACSKKSLELVPGSWAYQDTLGRCYYSVGDFANAIHFQKLAVDEAPYMQQMQRQLKLFEEALAKSNASSN